MAGPPSSDGRKNAIPPLGGLEASYRLLRNEDDDPQPGESSSIVPSTSVPMAHSLANSYRRPSFFTMVPRGTVVPYHAEDQELPTQQEWQHGLEEERCLLADNGVIIAPAARAARRRSRASSSQRQVAGLLSLGLKRSPAAAAMDEEAVADAGLDVAGAIQPTETTTLLGDTASADRASSQAIDRKWEEAVTAGLIHTTWQREVKVLARYTTPLLITFLLQNSLTVASIFTVGRIGKVELGAVSLASMTASITGYAVYQGLSTSLDTLCAQAYGSGRKDLVGLQMQRMVYFLWLITIPIGVVWFFADRILVTIVPEPDVARLAGQYLKIIILGCPGFACFEAGKRFVQAQGLFAAALFVLVICAPLNAFMNWLFVWQFEWGFVGAPLAVSITDTLLPLLLFVYVYFIDGMECWNGFTSKAFQNWGPVIRLALPGLVMVEAEVLAFEILTLASSYFGTTALAAQSILGSISTLTYTIPFTLSIAGSTRIANLIGASLTDAARTCAKVVACGAFILGIANITLLSALREYVPRLFTSDEDVVRLAAMILPVCASFQLFDALAACCNGVLRGLGRQSVGGYVQLLCYYGVAIPISMGTAFGLDWGLWGLWTGVAVGLLLVSIIEGIFLTRTDWERSVTEATKRNEMA